MRPTLTTRRVLWGAAFALLSFFLQSPSASAAARKRVKVAAASRPPPPPPPLRPADAPPPAPDDKDRDRVVRLQETLHEIAHNPTLRRLRVGMRVMEARTGRLFYNRRGADLMDPASNQKVLSTVTALMRLGPDWRFTTEIAGREPDAAGVIAGDIYLRGSGDPTIKTGDLEALAQSLAARGVKRIDGAVVADLRRIGSDEAEPEAKAPSSDGPERPEDTVAPVGKASARAPLVVNRGIMIVRVRPGDKAGQPVQVTTHPADEAFVVRNRAVTKAKGRTRIKVRLFLADATLQVEVAGVMGANHLGLGFRRKVPHQALYTAALLRSALTAVGIVVRDRPRFETPRAATADTVQLLANHHSVPLATLLRKINKDSDNDQSERLLEAVGAEVYGGPATTQKGLDALREVIGEMGLSPASYVPKNGSGLGHANRITPDAMAKLLQTIYLDPRVGPEILQSFSVGGVDGTTRNRFKGTLSAKRVRAKTGTLRGKSCLSGYVGDGPDVLVFSILVDRMRGRHLAAVRGAQVGAVNAMMRYVREGSGVRIDLPPGFDQAPAGTDFETGEELMSSEADAPVTTTGGTAHDPVDAFLRKEKLAREAREKEGGGGSDPDQEDEKRSAETLPTSEP
jgi:D-alanyl-D-alanine carboxypeptidase/D-alanyl-D-alanine-endopeptidase (penicillin-binding protein 4)